MMNYKDIYSLPLRLWDDVRWVYDSNDNFVFQFIHRDKHLDEKFIAIINGDDRDRLNHELIYEEGFIRIKDHQKLLLIRGWGNLTGAGGHNLSAENAANIQDSFANFIIERLTKKDNERQTLTSSTLP